MEFINTLVWDKRNPVTFWIGLRRYGYKTRKTQSGQEMKSGSEFEPVNLDDIIRSNDDLYKKFAERLYTNRLKKYFQQLNGDIDENVDANQAIKDFRNRFEKYREDKIIEEIIRKNSHKEYPHLAAFRKKFSNALKNGKVLYLSSEKQIEKLIDGMKKPTVIVLDNASVHRNKKMCERRPYWAARGLYIFYLPVYSPHLNIAEILWRKLKYEWLSAADYLDWENLKYQVRLGLSNVGSLLKINFSEFNHSLI